MKIQLQEIPIRELVKDYQDNQEAGVFGFSGKLNIRPPYQREFIYGEKQRAAVIDTIIKEFPLNVMYWAKCDGDRYEIIDGQQRTVSICQFVNGDFAFDFRYFENLQPDEQEQILNYKLMVYICEGSDSEKLQWFKTINIAGEKLTDQELRNAVYSGSWVSDAKRYFSKTNCPAYQIGSDFLNGSTIRQEFLETAIEWIANRDKTTIEGYMAIHQHDANALQLWQYFQSVITWANATFTTKHKKIIKGIDWGVLYDNFHDQVLDTIAIEKAAARLILDDDVTRKSGIYPYILTHNEKYLSLRAFTDAQKLAAYEQQQGICSKCGKHFPIEEMQADHITPWSKGGKTIPENCQMLCNTCNRLKSDI